MKVLNTFAASGDRTDSVERAVLREHTRCAGSGVDGTHSQKSSLSLYSYFI
jgi:hypothetical protein